MILFLFSTGGRPLPACVELATPAAALLLHIFTEPALLPFAPDPGIVSDHTSNFLEDRQELQLTTTTLYVGKPEIANPAKPRTSQNHVKVYHTPSRRRKRRKGHRTSNIALTTDHHQE